MKSKWVYILNQVNKITIVEFQQKLKSIDKKYNFKLILFLIILFLVNFSISNKSKLIPWLLIIILLGGLIYLIFSIIKEKKNLALEYGLKCNICNHVPEPLGMIQKLKTGQCRNCENKNKKA